ncbi:stalk domain-containing protein [Bacillus solimangrovi]|uniref:Copper amine oxidase-like N-terminal domain-containing protein n=1 Tax=Bacillus solimangrovi TaxID=1305675 RepID=A0A1E5LDD0_9BACI|nr:stalk domain-containing protein [Bacillus solimangrovi]OEH92085.1 hypothetical protein BFG57_16775 [Bacillus solimangrovi]
MKKLLSVLFVIALIISSFPQQSSAERYTNGCYPVPLHPRFKTGGYLTLDGTYIEFGSEADLNKPKLISVCVNNEFVSVDVPIKEEKGQVLIPIKKALQHLNATLNWDGKTNTVTVSLDDKVAKFIINKSVAVVNGQQVQMEVPVRMYDGNMYMPVQFLAEQFDVDIAWFPEYNLMRFFKHPDLRITPLLAAGKKKTNDYYYAQWFGVFKRFLMKNNGQIELIEVHGKELVIEELTTSFEKTGERKVKMELPMFGAAHKSIDGHIYVLYGDSNSRESAEKVVYRVVKYDDKWNKVGQVDITDAYVTVPFDASNATIDTNGKELIVHTGRLRYQAEDGKHHQSNMVIKINTEDMTLLYNGGQWPQPYSSHAFATYARFDGDRSVYAVHGDGYPRAIELTTKKDNLIENIYTILDIPGEIGRNYTGVFLGGLEVSKDSYLLVGASIYLNEHYGKNASSNVYVSVVPKDAEDESEVKMVWLTNYPVEEDTFIIDTYLVKMNDNKFVALWYEPLKKSLGYAVVDGQGNILKKPTLIKGAIPPGGIDPLVLDNKIIWYIYEGGTGEGTVELFTLTIEE